MVRLPLFYNLSPNLVYTFGVVGGSLRSISDIFRGIGVDICPGEKRRKIHLDALRLIEISITFAQVISKTFTIKIRLSYLPINQELDGMYSPIPSESGEMSTVKSGRLYLVASDDWKWRFWVIAWLGDFEQDTRSKDNALLEHRLHSDA